MKQISLLLLSLLFCFTLKAKTTTATSYAGGSGTSSDPYQIATLAQLKLLSETTGDWDKCFILTTDINASDTKTWNSGNGFSPIGNNTTMFTGSFNGNNYAVANLYMDNILVSGYGMFAYASGAIIKKLALTNFYGFMKESAGALVGNASNSTLIEECYVTGKVKGRNYHNKFGGLVGTLSNSTIKSCYTNCVITIVYGGSNFGGLIGSVEGASTIENCFVAGRVSADSYGGIAGQVSTNSTITNCYFSGTVAKTAWAITATNSGSITNCYYDKTINTGSCSHATGLAISEFSDESNFSGWDFTSTWKILALASVDSVKRPNLQWTYDHVVTFEANETKGSVIVADIQGLNDGADALPVTPNSNIGYHFVEWQDALSNSISIKDTLTVTNVTQNVKYKAIFEFNYAGGSGTSVDPYQIATLEQLKNLSENTKDWTNSFILTADIDATDTKTWNDGAGFSPIGDDIYFGNRQKIQFMGNINGDNHSISNLYINRNENYVGLIGCTKNATIKNINLINCNITCSENNVGGIVGSGDGGSVEKCCCTGSILNGSYVGGIIGEGSDVLITSCYTDCTISGRNYVGGIVGFSSGMTIQKCLVLGYTTTTAFANIGGIAGDLRYGKLTDSYVAGSLDYSDGHYGGVLLGTISYSTITNCYYDTTINSKLGAVSNYPNSNVTSLTTNEFAYETNFTGWNFNDDWKILALANVDSVKRPHLQWAYDHILTFELGINGDSIAGGDIQGIDDGANALSVKAIGTDGYVLKEWQDGNGNVVTTDNPLTLTNVIRDSTLYAIFQAGYNVEFSTDGNGTVIGDSYQGVTSGNNATEVTALAGTGYIFDEWRNAAGDSIINDNPLSVTNVTQDSTLYAIFQTGYKIKFRSDINGIVTGDTCQELTPGSTSSEVTAIANTGYHFDEWRNAIGDSITNINPLIINSVAQDSALTAVFEFNTYTVTFVDWDDTQLSQQTVEYSSSASAPANPMRTGFTFEKWDTDFSSITSDLTVTAQYTINTYSVKFKAIDNGSISGDTEQTVKYDSSSTSVEAVPNTGYQFAKWQDADGTELSTNNPFILTNVTSNTIVYAVFNKNTSISVPEIFNLNIYPNPTTGLVNIFIESDEAELAIYNTTGKLVYSNLSYNGGTINLSDLDQGMYLIKIIDDGNISLAWLIKQ